MIDLTTVRKADPEVCKAMEQELSRQRGNLELIASENIVSPALPSDGEIHTPRRERKSHPSRTPFTRSPAHTPDTTCPSSCTRYGMRRTIAAANPPAHTRARSQERSAASSRHIMSANAASAHKNRMRSQKNAARRENALIRAPAGRDTLQGCPHPRNGRRRCASSP